MPDGGGIPEQALAHSLRENHYSPYGSVKDSAILIEDVPVTHSYRFMAVDHRSLSDSMTFGGSSLQQYSIELQENFHAANQILDPKTISPTWIEFLKEVHEKQKEKGTDSPIDLLHGVAFLQEESPTFKESGITPIPNLEGGTSRDLRNVEQVKKTIDAILTREDLRGELQKLLSTLVPNKTWEEFNEFEIVDLLDQLGIKEGVHLDIGTGKGERVLKWKQETGLQTIGIDRQYRPVWYEGNWQKKDSGVAFAQADFTEGIPIKDDEVDLVTMESVVEYVDEEKLAKGITEIKRVLKPNGLFTVRPQWGEGSSEWRVFRKEEVLVDKNPVFQLVEYPIEELIAKK